MSINKELIGLTGNIATGKSVVRRMLVNHGALGLDADVIAHRTLYPGGKAYQSVIDNFGKAILTPDGEIDRKELGGIVFHDPERMEILENLIHPAVTVAVQKRIERSSLPLTVIEAIKLLESPLIDLCDTVWVSQATPAHQLERLLQTRNMTKETAWQRINAQSPQSEKRMQADVVINTEGAFSETWQQVHQALNDTIQPNHLPVNPYINIPQKNDIRVSPAGAIPIETFESFWQEATSLEFSDLYETLAFKTVLVLSDQTQLQALLIVEEWNFTSVLEQLLLDHGDSPDLKVLLAAFQKYSQKHQAEILIVPESIFKAFPGDLVPQRFGYEQRTASDMIFPAWRQALEKQVTGRDRQIWVKQLAQPLGFE
jgi:dephospho-CoA kinase